MADWASMSQEDRQRTLDRQRVWRRADRAKNPEKYRQYARDHRRAVKEHPERYRDGAPDFHKKRYAAEREKRKAAARSRYHRVYAASREWLDGVESFLGCFICGDDQPHRLAWHHLTPVGGGGTRVTTALHGAGVEGALEEMKRCILLCANCHKDVHHWRGDSPHGL